jgi:uncharacterized protein (UPF0264 family)
MPSRAKNRKLLVSVFNPQEAREAVMGGARIIDSEDPRSALGNIKPNQIKAISDAVLNYKRDLDIQLSTNIGEDQLLFDRSELGQAIEKSPYEIAGKASQAAMGVAVAMGVKVHPCPIVKVGVDGMRVELVREVLTEVVRTLKRQEGLDRCQVMSVLFAQDIDEWNRRKKESLVRNELIALREFHPADEDSPDGFDLRDFAAGNLRDRNGAILFPAGTNKKDITLDRLLTLDILPPGTKHTIIALNELFPHRVYFPEVTKSPRTNREVIKAMVDATADSGADAIMIDTQIQTKVARICCVDTSSEGMIDINRHDIRHTPALVRKGILTLDEIRFFGEYCHFRGVEANLAGSIESYQAQQLWALVPEIDHVSTRGSSSAVSRDPAAGTAEGEDTRLDRVIQRHLVRGLVPPEQVGVINFPDLMLNSNEALGAVAALRKLLAEKCRAQGLSELEAFFVDKYGTPTPVDTAARSRSSNPPGVSLSQQSRPPCSVKLPTEDDIRTRGNANWQKGLLSMSEWIWSGHLNYAQFPNNLGRFFQLIPGVFEQQMNFSTTLIFDEPSFRNGIQMSGFIGRVPREFVISLIAQRRRCWYSMTHHAVLGKLTADKHGMPEAEFTAKMTNLLEHARHPEIFSRLERALLTFADAFATNPKSYSDDQYNELKEALREDNKRRYPKESRRFAQLRAARGAHAMGLLRGADNGIASRAAFDSVSLDIPDDLNEWTVNAQLVELACLCMQFVALTDMFTALNIPDEDFMPDTLAQLVPAPVIEKINELNGLGGYDLPELTPPPVRPPVQAILEGKVVIAPPPLKGARVPLESYEGGSYTDRDKGVTVGGIQTGVYGWGFGLHFPGSLPFLLMHHPELSRYEAPYSLPLLFNEDEWRNGANTSGFVSRRIKELLIQKAYRIVRTRYGIEHHTMYFYNTFLQEHGGGNFRVPGMSNAQHDAATRRAIERAAAAAIFADDHENAPAGTFSALEAAILNWADGIFHCPHNAHKLEDEVRRELYAENLREIATGLRILDDNAGRLDKETALQELMDHQIAEMAMMTGHMNGLARLLATIRLEQEGAVQVVEGRAHPDGGTIPDLDAEGRIRLTGFFNNRPAFMDLLRAIGVGDAVLTANELLVNPKLNDAILKRLNKGETNIRIAEDDAMKTAEF